MKQQIGIFIAAILLFVFIITAHSRAETILIQDETAQTSMGLVLPIYSLLVGITVSLSDGTMILASERAAEQLKETFGPYSIDGDAYVRARDGGWLKTTFRRPKNADEHLSFLLDKKLFQTDTVGGLEILPPFFNLLPREQLEKILLSIVYRAGGMRITLYPMSGASAGSFKESWIRVAGL